MDKPPEASLGRWTPFREQGCQASLSGWSDYGSLMPGDPSLAPMLNARRTHWSSWTVKWPLATEMVHLVRWLRGLSRFSRSFVRHLSVSLRRWLRCIAPASEFGTRDWSHRLVDRFANNAEPRRTDFETVILKESKMLLKRNRRERWSETANRNYPHNPFITLG